MDHAREIKAHGRNTASDSGPGQNSVAITIRTPSPGSESARIFTARQPDAGVECEHSFRIGPIQVNHAMERPLDPPSNRVIGPNINNLRICNRWRAPVYPDVPVD